MNSIYPVPPKRPAGARKDVPGKTKQKDIALIIAIVLALQVALAVVLGGYLFKRGYRNAKDETAGRIRREAYDTVYGAVEKAHHVSNEVSISVSGIREKADLEVLEVDASYLYITDEEDKDRGLTIWYRIPGTGTFTVDMKMAEFLVDNERRHVLVRVPEPAITVFNEDYANVEKLFFKDGSFTNGSIREGEQTARKMLARAHVRMMKQFETTQAYYMAAEDSAVKLITGIVKALNPDVPGISVDVEFGRNAKTVLRSVE